MFAIIISLIIIVALFVAYEITRSRTVLDTVTITFEQREFVQPAWVAKRNATDVAAYMDNVVTTLRAQ